MKKLLPIFIIILLVSCSDDDAPIVLPDKVDGTLLKKAVYTNSAGQITTAEYTYENNRLLKVEANSGSSTTYVYTGNLITRINTNFGSLNTESRWLTYNSAGRLESVKKMVLDDMTYSVTYTDDDAHTVTIREYNGDFSAGAPMVALSKAFLANDGSVTRLEKYSGSNTLTYHYTYDDKTVPTADIIGYDKLRFYQAGSTSNPHNIVTVSGSDELTMINTHNTQGYLSTAQEGQDGPSVKYYYY